MVRWWAPDRPLATIIDFPNSLASADVAQRTIGSSEPETLLGPTKHETTDETLVNIDRYTPYSLMLEVRIHSQRKRPYIHGVTYSVDEVVRITFTVTKENEAIRNEASDVKQ